MYFWCGWEWIIILAIYLRYAIIIMDKWGLYYNLSFINIIRERKSKPWWWHHPKPASTHYCQICWPSQVPLSNNEQRPNNGERLDIIPFSSAMVAQGNATSRAGSASNYAHLIWRSFSCEPYLKKSLRALCGLRTSLRITTRHSPHHAAAWSLLKSTSRPRLILWATCLAVASMISWLCLQLPGYVSIFSLSLNSCTLSSSFFLLLLFSYFPIPLLYLHRFVRYFNARWVAWHHKTHYGDSSWRCYTWLVLPWLWSRTLTTPCHSML